MRVLKTRYNSQAARMNCIKLVLVSHYNLAKNSDLVNSPRGYTIMRNLVKMFNELCDMLRSWKPTIDSNYDTSNRALAVIKNEIEDFNFLLNRIIEHLFN